MSISIWPPPAPPTARLTRRIQRLDSATVALLVCVVVALGHRQRLVAGELICLRDGEAKAYIISDQTPIRL